MIKLTFDARTLKAALVCVSTDETRYYLKGVAVQYDAGQLFIVATDGHRIIAMQPEVEAMQPDADIHPTDALGLPYNVIIPVDIVKNLKLNKLVDECTLTIDGDKGELEHCGQSVRFNFIDGTFPDWRRIIPPNISGELAQFDNKYIGEMPKIVAAFGKKVTHISIEHNGDAPAFVALELPVPYVMLIMPYRDRNPEATIPSWAKVVRADKAIENNRDAAR